MTHKRLYKYKVYIALLMIELRALTDSITKSFKSLFSVRFPTAIAIVIKHKR